MRRAYNAMVKGGGDNMKGQLVKMAGAFVDYVQNTDEEELQRIMSMVTTLKGGSNDRFATTADFHNFYLLVFFLLFLGTCGGLACYRRRQERISHEQVRTVVELLRDPDVRAHLETLGIRYT